MSRAEFHSLEFVYPLENRVTGGGSLSILSSLEKLDKLESYVTVSVILRLFEAELLSLTAPLVQLMIKVSFQPLFMLCTDPIYPKRNHVALEEAGNVVSQFLSSING